MQSLGLVLSRCSLSFHSSPLDHLREGKAILMPRSDFFQRPGTSSLRFSLQKKKKEMKPTLLQPYSYYLSFPRCIELSEKNSTNYDCLCIFDKWNIIVWFLRILLRFIANGSVCLHLRLTKSKGCTHEYDVSAISTVTSIENLFFFSTVSNRDFHLRYKRS